MSLRGLCVLLTVVSLGQGWSISQDVPEKKKEEPPKLLGQCTTEQLGEEPYAKWASKGYEDYEPNPEIVAQLRQLDLEGVRLNVFFGTWCGDSRREVPHLLKTLDKAGFDAAEVSLIGVNNTPEEHKRSPSGEEAGKEIYRVPTIVVERDGYEVARIVEFPVLSLERDLLTILKGEPYEPNYGSYPSIRRWLASGLLSDENVSAHGLAEQVRDEVRSDSEIAAAARVLLSRGDVAESVKLFELNCALFPDSSRGWERLADARHKAGKLEQARDAAERALQLNEDPARVKALVQLVDRTHVPDEDDPEARATTD